MFNNIEELKAAILNGSYGISHSKYGRVSSNLIAPSMLENTREIEILLDLENHLSFKVLDELNQNVWCNKDKFKALFYYLKNYRIFNQEYSYHNLFDIFSKHLCAELKNDGHYLLTMAVSFRSSIITEMFIQKVSPKLLDNEEYKERYTKIINKAIVFEMAEKINRG